MMIPEIGLTSKAPVLRVLHIMRKSILPIALTVFLMNSCSLFRDNRVILCTNRVEMAAYIEYYNAQIEDLRVELCYMPSPVAVFSEKKERVDLIMGEWLTGLSIIENLESLEDLFKEERINRENFYEALLSSGRYEKKQAALPLSFNIPTVIFLPENLKEQSHNLVMPLEFIKEQGSQFNQIVRSQFRRMGFSPLWNKDFLYMSSVLLGAAFREDGLNTLTWDNEALVEAVLFLKIWINEINGGYPMEKEFTEKYMYQPIAGLLDENRILFYQADSQVLFQTLAEQKEEADFRWLSYENKIYVDEEILYLGIPKGARNRKGAKLFLEWLFRVDTQKKLLEINQKKRLKVFGIAGGFSALQEVNEHEFPQYYPGLIGRIPASDLLLFPENLPANWAQLKLQVIIPWLFDSTVYKDQTESLKSRIKSFQSEILVK